METGSNWVSRGKSLRRNSNTRFGECTGPPPRTASLHRGKSSAALDVSMAGEALPAVQGSGARRRPSAFHIHNLIAQTRQEEFRNGEGECNGSSNKKHGRLLKKHGDLAEVLPHCRRSQAGSKALPMHACMGAAAPVSNGPRFDEGGRVLRQERNRSRGAQTLAKWNTRLVDMATQAGAKPLTPTLYPTSYMSFRFARSHPGGEAQIGR
jgi:hypothetical protein